VNVQDEKRLMRRVVGYHDLRLDGMLDLVIRARGASVMDIGCNRGLVGFEMANNGATLVHGCDNYAEGIQAAQHLFADLRNVETQFEVVDLTKGAAALRPFGTGGYDIVLMLATYHKLKRIMAEHALSDLMMHLANRTTKWFGWRGTSEKAAENEAEMTALDRDFRSCGLKRIHTSYLSKTLGVAAIWERV
jgi:SAM-dependent methyltransferase